MQQRALSLHHVVFGTFVGLSAAFGFACGSSSGDDKKPGDATVDANAPDGVDTNGQLDGATPGPNPVDGGANTTCGGHPCANHTGQKTFAEADAPANAPSFFGGTPPPPGTNAGNEPHVVYPSHETMFPINVSHIRHEWTAGGTNDMFRLRFVGPKTTVEVYTSKTSWEPSDEAWDWIAESNRGSAVTFTVEGVNKSAPQSVWQSQPITLLFSDAEVEGAIYYWSTGTAGVMKALVSDRVPAKFYTDPAATDANTCVACHTVSKDGKRLAVGYGGEKLREVSVPNRDVLVPPPPSTATRASSWTTFSPDGKRLLVAGSGTLTLIDADTGATVGPNDGVVSLPNNKFATHPDWSALGDRVVVTLTNKAGTKNVEGGSIAILPFNAGAWGTPQVIVAATGQENNFFPVFSPDSKWIAFVRSTGGSKDALTATLMLVPADGGTPVTLTRVNRRVNDKDGVTNIANSMPTWAPSTKPGIFWIAFSSVRPYATVRPLDAKKDQIWIAAIDPTQTADMSYAGFWAPFQSIDQGNHRAFWAHTDTDQQCRCTDICGDGLDNNCNGSADETGCSTCGPVEICGNGIDDNCDCVVDNCSAEICNNGIDDDGDGLVDSADPACTVIK